VTYRLAEDFWPGLAAAKPSSPGIACRFINRAQFLLKMCSVKTNDRESECD
jgi:hypothetical protein